MLKKAALTICILLIQSQCLCHNLASDKKNPQAKSSPQEKKCQIDIDLDRASNQLDNYHNLYRTKVINSAYEESKSIKNGTLDEEKKILDEVDSLKDINRLSSLVEAQKKIADDIHKQAFDEADKRMEQANRKAKAYDCEKEQKIHALNDSAQGLKKLLKQPQSKYGHVRLMPERTNLYVRNYSPN